MSTEPVSTTPTATQKQGASRWPRLALLSVTLFGPAVGTALGRLRQQAATSSTASSEAAQGRQVELQELRQRFEELTEESRERVAQQIHYLRSQARQLKAQSRELRKAVRKEARQRQKWLEHARKAGLDWGHDMAKRSEELLEPVREHSRIWTLAGFGVGLLAAGAITYRLVRGRTVRQQAEDESIELAPEPAVTE